jgi:anti-sigma B factor antagonist
VFKPLSKSFLLRLIVMQSLLTRAQGAMFPVQGHVNAASAPDFQEQLTAMVSSDATAILVDMSQVESFDSAGLMVLVSALSLAQRLDKRFSLCCVPASARIMLELTQLDRVFEILPSPVAFEVV